MSRMHNSRKGKAGSKKPKESNVSWVPYKQKELELLVAKLAKAGDKGQITIRKPPVQLEESSFVTPSTSPQKKTILTPAGKQELNKRLKENPIADRKYVKTQLKMQSEQDPQKYGHLVMKKEGESFSEVVRRIVERGKGKSFLSLAGSWKDDKEISKVFDEIIINAADNW